MLPSVPCVYGIGQYNHWVIFFFFNIKNVEVNEKVLTQNVYLFKFTLQYCIGFAIHWHESTMGVHVFPILNPLPPPSNPIPLGHPSASDPSTLYHSSNLDWWLVSHMIIYMFQYLSPKSSHHCPLPLSPKDCSMYICVSFSVLHTGLSLPSF